MSEQMLACGTANGQSRLFVKEKVEQATKNRGQDACGVSLVTNYSPFQSQQFRDAAARVGQQLIKVLEEFPEVKNAHGLEIVGEPLHGTFGGLETEENRSLWLTKMYERLKLKESPPSIDIEGMCAFLHNMPFPFTIRFGGRNRGDLNPHGNDPDERDAYEQTFRIYKDGNMNLAGFPARSDTTIVPALIEARLGVERFGMAHKYHATRDRYYDNEYYAVVARVMPGLWDLSPERHAEFEAALLTMRDHILEDFRTTPITVPIEKQHFAVVKYRRTTLEPKFVIAKIPLEELTAKKLGELLFG